jgi:hypothetical protein
MLVDFSCISCGIAEVADFSSRDMDYVLRSIAEWEEEEDTTKAFYIWSNVDDRETAGHLLHNKIERLELGPVTKSATATNPNTKNPICMWTWQVNRDAFERWIADDANGGHR